MNHELSDTLKDTRGLQATPCTRASINSKAAKQKEQKLVWNRFPRLVLPRDSVLAHGMRAQQTTSEGPSLCSTATSLLYLVPQTDASRA